MISKTSYVINKNIGTSHKSDYYRKIAKDLKRYRFAYIAIIPVLLYYILFHYKPMYGILMAFQEYDPARGILGSKWVGFEHFITFFNSPYFFRVVRNTFLLNLYQLIFEFPTPIIFALLLNEIYNIKYKRVIQTITYFPHFISTVVMCGMIVDFCMTDGLFNDIIEFFGGNRTPLLQIPQLFPVIYVVSEIWKSFGWSSIIYLSHLSSIDPNLYEAATIDGAGRFSKIWNVTIPGILPAVVILLILRIGRMMSIGFEKIILLYNPLTYETADVISTYVYRKGLMEFSWSFSTAVGQFTDDGTNYTK